MVKKDTIRLQKVISLADFVVLRDSDDELGYYRKADIVMMVYDISNSSTFKSKPYVDLFYRGFKFFECFKVC